MVLATCVAAKGAKEAQDFFPLTVEYRERAYAGGRIPGGYFKREGAPVKKETLTARLIDRPIRPLFPEGFKNEVQVICLVVSGDQENDPDVLAMNGASAALCLSGIPFDGPVGAVQAGGGPRTARQTRPREGRASRLRGGGGGPRRRRGEEGTGAGGLGGGGVGGAAPHDRREEHAPRRAQAERDPTDHDRDRLPAARARLGALHARRDAGARLRDPRHQVRRAEDRGAGGRVLPALPAALQFPVVLGG